MPSLAQEKEFLKRYHEELEAERQELIAKWKEENSLKRLRTNSDRNLNHSVEAAYKPSKRLLGGCWSFLSSAEVFLSNMPLTIGAVGLGWVTQGVIWFKFMEENIDDCIPVHFNSNACTYPEFPGCFQCNTDNPIYRAVVLFHYFCHMVAGFCCLLFLLKALLARRMVVDELSNPATSTPCGVVGITMVCVAAGRGIVGEIVVLVTSFLQMILAFWFLYTAIFEYRLLPDPGWFPNTVGISYAAIKTWLYYPVAGKILMVMAMLFFFSTFFIR